MRTDLAIHVVASCLHQEALSTYIYPNIIFILAVISITAILAFSYIVASYPIIYRAPAGKNIPQTTPPTPCHRNHKDNVADLCDKLDLANAELKDSSVEIDLYILDLDAMRTQLAAETARADMASCKADVVSDKLLGLQRTLIAANGAIAAAKCEAAATSKELIDFRNSINTQHLDIAQCRKQLATARNEAEVSSTTVLRLEQDLERARAETATARAVATAAQDAATTAEDTIAATRMELTVARSDADDLSFQLKDAQATISKLEARNDTMNARLKQTRKELAGYKADSSVLLRSYDAADTAAFVMAHAVRVAELARLREKEATFDNFKSIYAQKSMSEAQARAQATALQEKLSKLEDKYAQLTKHHMKVFLEQASMQMDIDKLRAKELEIELDNAKLTRTISERDALQEMVNQLSAEAAVNKERHEQALAVQKSCINEAEKETSRQINVVIAERDRAQSEAYDLSVQNKNLQSTAANLRCEVSALQDRLRAHESALATATQQAECAALERSLSRPLARIEAIALQETISQRDAEIEELIQQLNSSCPPRAPTPESPPAPVVTQSGYQQLTPASLLELIEDHPLPTPPITPAGGVILRSPERGAFDTPLDYEDEEPVSPPRPVTPAATTPMHIPVRIGGPPFRPSTFAELFSSIPQAPVGPPSPIPRSSKVKPSHLGHSRLPRLVETPRHDSSVVPLVAPAARSPASVPLPASPATGGTCGTPVRRRSPRTVPRRSNENALNATPRYFGLPMPRPAFSPTPSPPSRAKPEQPVPSSVGPKNGTKQNSKQPQSAGPKKGLKER